MRANLKELDLGDICTGACAALVVVIVYLVIGGPVSDISFLLVFGSLAGVFVSVLRHAYMAALRVRAASKGPTWDVEVNGVSVGQINDAYFAAVRLEVFSDVRTYVAQVVNCGSVLVRVFDWMLVGVPMCAFWGLLALAVISPQSCEDALAAIRAASPESIAHVAGLVARYMMTVGLIAAIPCAMFGARFGFSNRFSAATSREIRRELAIAVDGPITLSRMSGGIRRVNDELDALQKAM